jgi:hypothetical protein
MNNRHRLSQKPVPVLSSEHAIGSARISASNLASMAPQAWRRRTVDLLSFSHRNPGLFCVAV